MFVPIKITTERKKKLGQMSKHQENANMEAKTNNTINQTDLEMNFNSIKLDKKEEHTNPKGR